MTAKTFGPKAQSQDETRVSLGDVMVGVFEVSVCVCVCVLYVSV